MVINIPKNGQNIKSLMRTIGYIENHYGSEPNFVRPLGAAGYPRFHIYPRQTEGGFSLNLHLDAKKPIYRGVPAHSGEYDGKVVEDEERRIKSIFEI